MSGVPAAGALALALLAAAPSAALEIVALANEGVLLRAGETTVVIDGAIVHPYVGYEALPPEAWAAMLAGEPPFEDLDLLLVSHPHGDHFDPDATAELLRARPEVRLISSPAVVEAVRARLDEPSAAARLEVVAPAPGETIERTVGEARIRFLRLRHGGRTYEELWNLGHAVELGGARSLHIGDAQGDPGTFEAYDLPSLEIDLGLLPYWVFGEALADGLLGGRGTVALHVPASELAQVRAELRPRVALPGPMERVELEEER